MRQIAFVLLLLACNKKEAPPEPEPVPTTGARGHSVTKLKEQGSEETPEQPREGSGSTTVTAAATAEIHAGTGNQPAEIDAGAVDNKNKPAYRDDQNRVHPPGGPIFMGRGADCTPERDHCLRAGAWFASGPYRPGALFRATPVFEFEGKVWTFRGDELRPDEYAWLLKTTVATTSDVRVGEPIVWLIRSSSDQKIFLNNENDALTSSRWDVGVVDSVGSDFIRVKGWDSNIPIESVRVVTEKKKSG